MTRENLAEVLEDIALLLELKGENPFKIRAYRQGAEVVLNFDGDIVELAEKNELTGIKGIGDALRVAETGALHFADVDAADDVRGVRALQRFGVDEVIAPHARYDSESLPIRKPR